MKRNNRGLAGLTRWFDALRHRRPFSPQHRFASRRQSAELVISGEAACLDLTRRQAKRPQLAAYES